MMLLQFDSTNQVMQNLIPKLRQSSIFEKPGNLSKKLKPLNSSSYHRL